MEESLNFDFGYDILRGFINYVKYFLYIILLCKLVYFRNFRKKRYNVLDIWVLD